MGFGKEMKSISIATTNSHKIDEKKIQLVGRE